MEEQTTQIEQRLILITQQFLTELGAQRAVRQIHKTAQLDRDLGIDSLGKVELLHRIEKNFDIKFSDRLLAEAETLEDIITAIESAAPEITNIKPEFVEQLAKSQVDPSKALSLLEVLYAYGKQTPERPHIYLQDETGQEEVITYGQLIEQAQILARGLAELGIERGDTVAIMLPTCANFFYAFFGVQLAGGIPIPIYPPFRPNRITEYAMRESHILNNAQTRVLITFERAEGLSNLLRTFIKSLKTVTTVDQLMQSSSSLPKVTIKEDGPAMIQYTSGSTSTPKGVLLNHANLLANIRAYGQAINVQPNDCVVSWLPLYHDMGLIGAWLGSFYYGLPATIMSPLTFLARPERWLWAIHYHRATVSAGPNFAYELCVSKIHEADIEGLDLSHWRLAFNGAEAINPKTLQRFIEKFEPYGFKAESLYPVYGLAESSVALTFPTIAQKPRIDAILRGPLENNNQAEPANLQTQDRIEFVSCGKPLPGHEIRIVDTSNQPLPERHVGNLQFRGPSAMQGYFRNPKATEAVYHDGWWDTGDSGYIADGDLFITGRIKDIIIKAGRNLHPEEIEEITTQVKGIRKGCVAVFGVSDTQRGTEKLVIAAETAERNSARKQDIINEVTEKVTTAIGIPPDEVVLVPPKTIPKTSSGKLRRSSCKNEYVAGKIGKKRKPVWLQVVQLYLTGVAKQLLLASINTLRFIYSAYLLLIAMILTVIMVPVILMAPKKISHRWTQFWTKMFFKLGFCPVKVINRELLHSKKPLIYVANHTSYLDSILTFGLLPPSTAFVAKIELSQSRFFNTILNKLNVLYVNRFDFTESLEDSKKLQHALERGLPIAIFPEGTFHYTSGLRPFKLGAFKLAVDNHIDICPIAIKGLRTVLRERWLLARPNKITVTVGKPITPAAKEWSEVTRLMKQARQHIATHCGEQELNY